MSHLAALQSAKTIHDVAALLGFKASALAYILYSKSAQPTYKKFQVPKRGGGMREIAAPIPQLKLLQRGSCKTPVARVIEVASVVFTRQQEEGVGGQLWQDAIV
jgi:hypothetical protein